MRSSAPARPGTGVLPEPRTHVLRVGCEFVYESDGPCPAVFLVEVRTDGPAVVLAETWEAPAGDGFVDAGGNRVRRVVLDGRAVCRYDARVRVVAALDEMDLDVPLTPVEHLPGETVLLTLPSRYVLPDVAGARAWDLFGAEPPTLARVQAVCDWLHANVAYTPGSSDSLTTAVDVLASGKGVCRDFVHAALTFCRALNIPARYVCGYLPDIGVVPPDTPMDFHAWMEVYAGGRWWTFDPRHNRRREGRAVIARGRDAVDVAMVTTFGPARLAKMTVWADPVAEPA